MGRAYCLPGSHPIAWCDEWTRSVVGIGQVRVVPLGANSRPDPGRVFVSGATVFKPVSSKLDVSPGARSDRLARAADDGALPRPQRSSERRFSVLDGPITANNPMGVHHAWGRTYKTCTSATHTCSASGSATRRLRLPGVWIEVEVERELVFNNKRQIEEFGIDRFVEMCKERVQRLAAIRTSRQAARHVDGLEHSYFTNSDENN